VNKFEVERGGHGII